jgi:hypothetical protein
MRTIRDVLDDLRGPMDWEELTAWPPDIFAITGVLLAQSGAFRLTISPPDGKEWPPRKSWASEIRALGDEWALAARFDADLARPTLPTEIASACTQVKANQSVAVADVDDRWDIACDLLLLHAAADEACRELGISSARAAGFALSANLHLTANGTLSRIAVDRLRVLPKLRTPAGGITIRSLSRYLALLNAELRTTWHAVPQRFEGVSTRIRFRLLAVPWPRVVYPSDFSRLDQKLWPLANMDRRRFGFFSFEPKEQFEATWVGELVDAARDRAGGVEAVVLPELAVTPTDVAALEAELAARNVDYLITGVRGGSQASLSRNFVHLGVGTTKGWQTYEQDKHHRWCLEREQIHQYHLGSALHPEIRWWEAIEIPARSRVFVVANQWLVVCPVICEDLARMDPVADSVHAVGPSLVIALLLDGPQLAARWPGRYASALADDPGSSVLTLTSLGMAERSRLEGEAPSRVIGLWKDPRRGTRHIELDRNAEAALLTLSVELRTSVTADGREDGHTTPELVLSGIEQIAS